MIMKYIFTLIIILSLTSCSAQIFTGTLDKWEQKKAEVVTGLMKPKVIGTIDENGNFNISLPENYLEAKQKKIEEENSNSENWNSSLLTVKQVFNCYGDSLQVTNGDQYLTTLGTMSVFDLVNMKEKKKYGFFLAASSKTFAEAYASFGQKNAKQGFVVDYYYVSEPAMVKGTCLTVKYTGNNDENFEKKTDYNLNFKKGWNIVKYKIEEVYKSSSGKTYAKNISYSTCPEFPKNIVFAYFKD